MTATQIPLLLGVGVFAGMISAVAGLASVVSYPALLAIGLPPLSANVTNTVAQLCTGVGAAAGSRTELAGQGDLVRRTGLVTMAGGAIGATLLLVTPSGTFEAIVPWLVGSASLLLLVSPRGLRPGREPGRHRPVPVAAMFCVALYIGFFGAAGGILMLAILVTMLDQPLAAVNAVKNVVAGLANAVAAVGFAVFGPVVWSAAAPLALGFLAGGWVGPALVRRIPGRVLRLAVGGLGVVVAVKLGFDTYR